MAYSDNGTGTAERDYILASEGGPNHTINGGLESDLIFGDFWTHFSTTSNSPNGSDPLAPMDLEAFGSDDWITGSGNPLVTDDSIPHTAVHIQGSGTLIYMTVTIGAGETITVDADFSEFDTVIQLRDSAGTVVKTNDDASNDGFGIDFGSEFSSNPNFDSFLEAQVATAGTYTIVIGQFDSGATDNLGAIGTDLETLLNISVTGHAATGTITAGDDIINGGDGNDLLLGMAGDDTINGDAGDDTIEGGTGDDILDGGAGTDTLSYASATSAVRVQLLITTAQNTLGAGTDTISNFENIIGSDHNDTLAGTGAANVITGGLGNDDITGFTGVDTLSGGEGNDTFAHTLGNQIEAGDVYDGGSGVNSLRFESQSAGQIYDARLGDFTNIQNLEFFNFFGHGADVILNAGQIPLNDIFTQAHSGSNFTLTLHLDTQTTLDLSATTFSGAGFNEVGDTITITGDADAEFITGSSINDIINGGDGDDTIEGGAGADTLDGGEGIDTLSYASSSAVTINLTTGIATGSDADGDVFTNFENVYGSQFNDILTGDAGNNTLEGDLGNDRLDGGDGDDILIGGEGADTLFGGAGADVMDGGFGFDNVDYRGASSAVRFDATTGGTLGDADGDTYSGIERYFLSNFNDVVTGTDANEFFFGEDGNDTINGGGGIDRINGGAGNDILRGQEGNDLIFGSSGGDQINGGTGFDVVSYENSTSRVVLNLASGGTLGDAAGDTYFGIEVVRGSDFDDILAGNGSTNELRGGLGDDILNGGGGNDRLFGGEGADQLNGGTGVDIANYTLATEGVGVDLTGTGFSSTGTTTSEAIGDTYSSIEWVFGSDFIDNITGDAANNRLEGRGGDDTLNGGAGNDRLLGGDGQDNLFGGDGIDTLFGQAGNDQLFGEAGNDFFFGSDGGDLFDGGADFDTASYLASSSGVTLNLETGGTGGDADGDTYVSIERVFGTSFDDNIFGSDGDDVLLGNGGADDIFGGQGNDSLVGGAGIDEFGYATENGGADVINDFFAGERIFIFSDDPNFDSFAEMQGIATDAGANVIFDFGGGNTLTVVGRNIADMTAADFIFAGGIGSQAPKDVDGFAQEAPAEDIFGASADYDMTDFGLIA